MTKAKKKKIVLFLISVRVSWKGCGLSFFHIAEKKNKKNISCSSAWQKPPALQQSFELVILQYSSLEKYQYAALQLILKSIFVLRRFPLMKI